MLDFATLGHTADRAINPVNHLPDRSMVCGWRMIQFLLWIARPRGGRTDPRRQNSFALAYLARREPSPRRTSAPHCAATTQTRSEGAWLGNSGRSALPHTETVLDLDKRRGFDAAAFSTALLHHLIRRTSTRWGRSSFRPAAARVVGSAVHCLGQPGTSHGGDHVPCSSPEVLRCRQLQLSTGRTRSSRRSRTS